MRRPRLAAQLRRRAILRRNPRLDLLSDGTEPFFAPVLASQAHAIERHEGPRLQTKSSSSEGISRLSWRGVGVFDASGSGGSSTLILVMVAVAPGMFLKNTIEELTWRGFGTPTVFATGMSRLGSHVLLGVCGTFRCTPDSWTARSSAP